MLYSKTLQKFRADDFNLKYSIEEEKMKLRNNLIKLSITDNQTKSKQDMRLKN